MSIWEVIHSPLAATCHDWIALVSRCRHIPPPSAPLAVGLGALHSELLLATRFTRSGYCFFGSGSDSGSDSGSGSVEAKKTVPMSPWGDPPMFCMHAVSCLGRPVPEQIFAVPCLSRPVLRICVLLLPLGVTNMGGEPQSPLWFPTYAHRMVSGWPLHQAFRFAAKQTTGTNEFTKNWVFFEFLEFFPT